MIAEPATLDDLHRASEGGTAPWLLDLVLSEVGGGRFDPSNYSVIDSRPSAIALRISGLTQTDFEVLIERYGHRFVALQFWKCPRLEDLSPLETLPNLRLASFYWNQRASRLWDLDKTRNLRGLHFFDFTRLHDLRDLAHGASLAELEFGDAVWDKSTFETLDPLASLPRLKALTVGAKRIEDGRVDALGSLQQLSSLSFSSNQFTMRQVAWLRARLPGSLQSEALEPMTRFARPFQRDGKELDVLLVGKRKPFLNSVADAARVHKHLAEFDRLVTEFRADPSLPPQ